MSWVRVWSIFKATSAPGTKSPLTRCAAIICAATLLPIGYSRFSGPTAASVASEIILTKGLRSFLPPPERGEGWGGGDYFFVILKHYHPPPNPLPSREGEFLGPRDIKHIPEIRHQRAAL